MKANLLANEKTAPLSNTLLSTFVGSTIPLFDLFSRTNKLRVISTDGVPKDVMVQRASRLLRANAVLRPYERTFAMIKPDAVGTVGAVPAILEAIAGVNLSVVYTKLVKLTEEAAGAFYAEHSARPFFPRLKQFMTSGPVLAMILEGTDAIRTWRILMGPTNTQVAEKEAPNSLRARFGTDGTMNATHMGLMPLTLPCARLISGPIQIVPVVAYQKSFSLSEQTLPEQELMTSESL